MNATIQATATANAESCESAEERERREEDEAALTDVLATAAFIAAIIAGLALCFPGCKHITTAMDGSIFQVNQYTGLTLGYGNARTISQGTTYLEQTEQVTTSIFNSDAKDYRRVTVWASPSTNTPPPAAVLKAFAPVVDTDILYSHTTTNGSSIINVLDLKSVPAASTPDAMPCAKRK